jgi:hypothetical protein
MSKEMLPGKLSVNQAVSVESPPITVEKKKKKRGKGGRLLLFLMAVGLGAVVLTSITVLAPVSFYGYVESPGSINDDSGNRGDGVAAIPTALAASFKAIDGKGNVIEDNGVTTSHAITLTGYSDTEYDPRLQCSIDSLHIYCSETDEISISGLHTGKHTFTVVESSNGETIVRDFSWNIS